MDNINKDSNKESEIKNNISGNGNDSNAGSRNDNSGNNPDNGNPNGGNNGRKDITIIVNGTPHAVAKEEMPFLEIIGLAELATGPNVSYTLTYRKGHSSKPEGSMVEGDLIKVKDGMIFNATATNKS